MQILFSVFINLLLWSQVILTPPIFLRRETQAVEDGAFALCKKMTKRHVNLEQAVKKMYLIYIWT